jgi:hypothetical protein
MAEKSEHHDVPANPQHHPEQTVDALERKASSGSDRDEEEGVAAEDVTDNPDTGELEGLPGPSPDEPGEPAG